MYAAKLWRKPMMLLRPTLRFYRSEKPNPYMTSEVKINPIEEMKQQDLPVWQRIFDHKRYMEHEGPLKMATGLAQLDVEPFPRLKLMKLYYMTLDEIKDIPDTYEYKQVVEEVTKHRMEIVDSTKSIRDIEEKISWGIVEDLIVQAHNELRLMKIVKAWKPWEMEEDMRDVNLREEMTNMNVESIFPTATEDFKHERHNKPKRPATGGFTPGNKMEDDR